MWERGKRFRSASSSARTPAATTSGGRPESKKAGWGSLFLSGRVDFFQAICLPAGKCPHPSRHWASPRVYTLFPHAIGAPREYMPPPLTQLVRCKPLQAACLPGHCVHPPGRCTDAGGLPGDLTVKCRRRV
eukprot:1857259-Pyramimonas_sp.AAC.1